MGIALDAHVRIFSGIRHILAASRDQGHCYLSLAQIDAEIRKLLELALPNLPQFLQQMEAENLLRKRILNSTDICYYSKTLYYDELNSADRLLHLCRKLHIDQKRMEEWIQSYNSKQEFSLSEEQMAAITGLVSCGCGILTGGPGCGKTTTTKTLVSLLLAMGKTVQLAAPTGRAAQRMEEVIGLEAKTIHRLLGFQNGGFKHNQDNPLHTDVLIIDECSMLDISLSAALLAAMPKEGQLILIGDADQLPSVGAGNVLSDLLQSKRIPHFRLQTVFRQAKESFIVSYAHTINRGEVPTIDSPFKKPQLWKQRCDCLFIDSNEATQEQLRIIKNAKKQIEINKREETYGEENLYSEHDFEVEGNAIKHDSVAAKYEHINFGLLQTAENSAVELRAVLKKTHPWSSLYYGLTASQVVMRLYSEWIPKYYGKDAEIQVLSPMTRGSLGTMKLNHNLQNCVNPAGASKAEISLGDRVFRVGDRVIHRKNNYDLGVYNGDIGVILAVNALDLCCTVKFLSGQRQVEYQKEQISELDLAYSITIHKSQGSEFDCVIIPLLSQHFKMLFRNLIYTGLTRAKKLVVFVGTRQALAMAVRNVDTAKRQTALAELLR